LEWRWARTAIRTYATVQLLTGIPVRVWLSMLLDGEFSWRKLLIGFVVCYLSWIVCFSDEYRTPYPRLRMIPLVAKEIYGQLILVYHQIRRLFGFSYLPWRSDPLVVANGGSMSGLEQRESFQIPDFRDGGWETVAELQVDSGRVLVCDPAFLHNEFDGLEHDEGEVIFDLPTGLYTLRLQIARLREPYGETILRAAFIHRGEEFDEIEGCGRTMVDLARLCVGDAERVRHVISALGESFDAFDLIEDPDPYYTLNSEEDGLPFITIFESGFGDGVYPVFLACRNNKKIGLVVDMSDIPEEGELVVVKRRGWRSRAASKS